MGTVETTNANSLSKMKKMGLRKGFNTLGGVFQGATDFYMRRHDHPDESLAKSAVIGGATTAMWMLAPGVAWGVTLGGAAYDASKGLAKAGASAASMRQSRYSTGGGIGGNFQDNEKGYTARQRGVEAIEQSRMNARSALGNEARSLHRR